MDNVENLTEEQIKLLKRALDIYAFYIAFFRKLNTYDGAQLGVYLINAVASNGGRVAIKPLAELGENMSVTIEIVDGNYVLTLDTHNTTYMRGQIFKIA